MAPTARDVAALAGVSVETVSRVVMRLDGDRARASEVRTARGSLRTPTGGGDELWSFSHDGYEVLARYVQVSHPVDSTGPTHSRSRPGAPR